MSEPLIDVTLVEDDRVFRAGIAELIATEPGMRCTRRYDSVEAALAAPATPTTDVILLDLNLRGMMGSEGVIALRSRYPTAAILMLTVYADEERIFESICNGARGYVLKNTPSARLLEFVRAVHAGGAPMSPEVASKVLRVFRELRPAVPRTDFALTSQELRLVGLLAEGHSYQNAAEQLSISINTIRNHVRSVYDKLHVHSKSEAVAKALKHGLLR